MTEFLSKTIGSIITKKPVTCQENDTILQALKKSAKEKVSAMPVWSETQKKHIGFFDILDVITFIATMGAVPELVQQFLGQQEISEDTWSNFIKEESVQLKVITCGQLLEISQARSSWKFIDSSFSLQWVMDLLNHDSKVRRIAVMENDQLIGVASQSLLLSTLAKESQSNPELSKMLKLDRTLEEIEKSTHSWDHPLVTINGTENALAGFQKLTEHGLLGIPVVNEENVLLGCLSANDLKASEPFNIFTDLYLPCVMYLEKSSELFPRYQNKSLSPITVQKKDTMADTLKKISENQIHRIFIVDSENHLLNVLSLCDIISLLQVK